VIQNLDPGQRLVASRTIRSQFYSPRGRSNAPTPRFEDRKTFRRTTRFAVAGRSVLGRFDVAGLRAAR